MTEDRFKFRFWNKSRKIMETFNNSPLTLGGLLLGKNDNYKILSCTGLKDKNGKLIYEGDIINIWCKNLTKNQISEVKFCKERAAFTFDYFTDYGNIVPCTMEKTEIVVIGNIYENPELVED